jgi:hypothetical protein
VLGRVELFAINLHARINIPGSSVFLSEARSFIFVVGMEKLLDR